MFKKEAEYLVLAGFLKKSNFSEQGSPAFTQLKPKTNQVCIQSYLRNLNKQLNSNLYPKPKINEMILKLEGFEYATTLDFNMV